MGFTKFNSIENVERQKFMDYVLMQGITCPWVVSEKIHGANYSLYYTGEGDIRAGRRSGLIPEGEKFYNHVPVKLRYARSMINLFMLLKEEMECEELTVFGELHGGSVQSGVYYREDQDFYAFDVVVNGTYLPVSQATELLKQFGFFYARPLFTGTLTEAVEYPNKFDSTIPGLLGEEVTDNICEGTVIRPEIPHFLPSGSRVIFKNKNEKWKEKSKTRKPKTEIAIPDEVKDALEQATAYINENRLKNVLSKIGEVQQSDFGKIAGLFTKDVIEDFIKDFDIESLGKDRKILTKQIQRECATVLRANFVNILDGVF
jgi:Rnl2 family RNA ligase